MPAEPLLLTPRLLLRHLDAEEDAGFMLGLLNEPSFLRFIGDRGVRTLEDAREYIRGRVVASYRSFGFGMYLTARREDGEGVGICGLVRREGLEDADLGFALLPGHWGRGYAWEAADAVLEHARRDLGLPRVAAVTDPDNQASARVLVRLGFAFQRVVRLREQGPELRLFLRELESRAPVGPPHGSRA